MADRINVERFIRYALVIILLVLAFFVLKPYLAVMFTSLVIAYMVYPVYVWLLRRLKNETLTAGLLTVLLFFAILIPLALTANILITEAANLLQAAQVGNIEQVLAQSLNLELTEPMKAFLRDLSKQAVSYVLAQASGFVLAIPSLILNFIIMLFVFFYALKDGPSVLRKLKESLPLKEFQKERIQKRFGTTIESLVYGEIAISLLEGIIATIGFLIIGVPSPVFWGLIVGFAALLPAIGPGAIWIPISILLYLNGRIGAAIALVVFGSLILSLLLDTIVRAKILGIKGHIHPVVILVGVLGGLAFFGIVGLILGPLIVVLLELVVEMYLEEGRRNAIESK